MANTRNHLDIELGLEVNVGHTSVQNQERFGRRCFRALNTYAKPRTKVGAKKKEDQNGKKLQVEDYPPGYPRFSALMAAHDSFHIFRRFSYLRMRLLLVKQNKLVQLEKRLDIIDREERSPLFLASNRRDTNPDREETIVEIENALTAYDTLLEHTRRVRALENPHRRPISSLNNWLAGTASISRAETEFLTQDEDLFSLSSPTDGIVLFFEQLVSRVFVYFGKRHWSSSNMSRDTRVFLYSRTLTDQTTRLLLVPFIICLLLVPVVACNMMASLRARLATIILAVSLVIAILSLLTKSKTVELMVACATYSAALIAFIASSK